MQPRLRSGHVRCLQIYKKVSKGLSLIRQENLFPLAMAKFTANSMSMRWSSSLSGWQPKDSAHKMAAAVTIISHFKTII
jgi:hypothetical protein